MTFNLYSALQFVDGNEFFYKEKEGGYGVVGYLHNGAFHKGCVDKDLLECRFSKFIPETGKCIALPMEKFFNYGDGLYQRFHGPIDQDPANWLYETKHDGSLINPVIVDDELLFMTKNGHGSEVAKEFAEWFYSWADSNDIYIVKSAASVMTVNIEYTSPKNKIVVDYDDTKMVILSARWITEQNDFGSYISQDNLGKLFATLIRKPYVDIVEQKPVIQHGSYETLDEFCQVIYKMEDTEGVILYHVPTQTRLKHKTEWYLERHGTVGIIFNFEKVMKSKGKVVKLYFADDFDDVLPHVNDDLEKGFMAYADTLDIFVDGVYQNVQYYVDVIEYEGCSKRDFALKHRKNMKYGTEHIVFRYLDGKVDCVKTEVFEHLNNRYQGMNLEQVENELKGII